MDRSPPTPDPYEVAHRIGEALRRLYRATRQEPLSAMVRAVHAEVEARNARAVAAEPVACRAGCAFCCHQQVTATAAEILVLARRIVAEQPRARARLRSAITAADSRTRGLDPVQRWAQRERCPLLGADALCSVYEHRPVNCRGYASLDVSACEQAFGQPDADASERIPRPRSLRTNAIFLGYALEWALRRLGFAGDAYDLNHGLVIALEVGPRPATLRYLAGEDVLAPARVQRPRATLGAKPAAADQRP